MAVRFLPVTTEEQIAQLAQLADSIWHEYWPSRIGIGQTDYMVEKFQSFDAIRQDMAENSYEYWFICETVDEEEAQAETPYEIIGYTGGHVEPSTNRFFISKIYVIADRRGEGFCTKTIEFYENLCRNRGLDAMYLTVNKYNDIAIRAYLAKGFETIDATETDIGEGFIMDDYIMEKKVARESP